MDQKSLYQLYKACRLCGAEGGYKMPIVQNFITVDDTDVQLKKKIGDSVQIQVNDGDKMPPLICGICVDKVDEYFAFKELCKKTNEETRKKLGLPLQCRRGPLSPDEELQFETSMTSPTADSEIVDTPETPLCPKKEREDSPKRDIKKEKAQAKREADLKNKETKLRERDIELKSRDKALRVRDIDLKQREVEFKLKESAVKVKDTQIKNKDSQLKSFDAILRNKDVELTLKQNQIRAKEQELQQIEETKTQKLKEKELSLKKKEAELKKKEANLKKMEIENRKKLESERAELRKKESLKRLRESDIDESIVNVQTPRGSRSSSISGRTSKQLRRSEDKPDGSSSKTTRNLGASTAISESQAQEELIRRLTRSKEREAPKPDTTPEKKAKLSSNPPSAVKTTPAQPVLCEVCSTSFKHEKSLKGHLRVNHTPNTNPKYVCNPCHLWFTNIETMNSHQREHKVNNLPYKCSNCELSFTTEKDYQEHFAILDCYIYTVPDVQCPVCSRFFATETLKSQHQCLGEEETRPETSSIVSQGLEPLKNSKEQEVDSASSAPASEATGDPSIAISEDAKENDDESSSKTRGPGNVLAEPQVLASLRPVQVRTEKCDLLLQTAEEDLVDVSNVDYNYGLDKSCVYPYFALYPRIKQEPPFNYFRGMVKINQDVKDDFLLQDYIHWDSEESENEFRDTRNSVENVKTLAQLSLKVIFSKKLIGKVPRKRRKIKNEYSSVLNVSLFDLGANCFDFNENMDDSNEAGNNITDNLTEDDNSANSNDNIERNGLDKRADDKNQAENDKNDGGKIESVKKTGNADATSNKNINIPEHSNDVSLYEEYIKSKNNEEQQNRLSNSDTADRDEEVNQSDTNVNNDDVNNDDVKSSTDKPKIDDGDSNSSNNSVKDDITYGTSETNIEHRTENNENEELERISDSESVKQDVVDKKDDSNEINAENTSISNSKSTESDDNDLQNDSNASKVTSFVQNDITDHVTETEPENPEVKTDDSNVQQDSSCSDVVDKNKCESVNGNLSENGDPNSTEFKNDDAKDNKEHSIDKKYDFITHNNDTIPFFESNDGPIRIHSNEISDSVSDKRTVPFEIENNRDKLDRLSDIVESTAKNEDSHEIDKLMRDLKELSKDASNTTLNADEQNNTDDLKTSDTEMDDSKLMSELNQQIGEKGDEIKHLHDGVNSEKFKNKDGNLDSLSVLNKSHSLDAISDEDSNFE